MATVKLKQNARLILQRADPEAMVQAAGRRNPRGPWLQKTNRYRVNSSKAATRDLKPGNTPVHKHVADYVAASAPLHCADGWGYLGQAMLAGARGAPDVARHLAYYAELRGALGLLATQGIGVFNSVHAVIDSSGQARLFRGPGTHEMAWLTLDWWSRRAASRDLLPRLIRPSGSSLADWIDALPAGGSSAPISGFWLRQWGMDISRMSADRIERNWASYQPTGASLPDHRPAHAEADFLSTVWSAFEPIGTNPFQILDEALLHASLDANLRQTATKPAVVETVVSDLVDRMIGTGPSGSRAKAILNNKETNQHPGKQLVSLANQANRRTGATHHLEASARAALLLRVASGASIELFKRAGRPLEEFSFWWEDLGATHGFWTPAGGPINMLDTWADIEAALALLDDLGAHDPSSTFELLGSQCAPALLALAGCERIPLWGIAA